MYLFHDYKNLDFNIEKTFRFSKIYYPEINRISHSCFYCILYVKTPSFIFLSKHNLFPQKSISELRFTILCQMKKYTKAMWKSQYDCKCKGTAIIFALSKVMQMINLTPWSSSPFVLNFELVWECCNDQIVSFFWYLCLQRAGSQLGNFERGAAQVYL